MTDVTAPRHTDPHFARAYERRWWVLGVLCISLFLVVVDNLIINVALPTLQREFDASTTGLQWIVDAYSLVFAALLLAAGGLGDRFGRKGSLQIGLVLFVICSTLAAFSDSTNELIFWRGAMGVGASLVFPATLAIITNLFTEPVERAKAIGLWSAVSGIAVAFGPIAGGFLLTHFWWGSVFFINLPIVAVALIAGAYLLPKSRNPEVHKLDKTGFVLSTLFVGSLVYTVIESPHWGWASTKSNVGFAISIVALIAFVAWELRTPEPLLDVKAFRNARFSAATSSIGVAFFVLFGFTFLVTQYFQFVRGYSALSSGVHTLPFAVGAGVTAPFAARAALKFGTKRVVALGLFNMGVGLVIISQQDADAAYWGPIVISMVLMANGLALVTSPATDAVMGELPLEKAGVGSAVNDTSREVGGTLGVAVVGSVFVSLYGPKMSDNLSDITGLVPLLQQNAPEALEASQDSVGAAYAIASDDRLVQFAEPIRAAASDAFMSGFHSATVVAACVAFVGCVCALVFLPSYSERPR